MRTGNRYGHFREGHPMKRRHGLVLVLLLLAAAAGTRPAPAKLSEPSHLFYGAVTVNGAPISSGSVSVRLESTGEELATYQVGSDDQIGDRYVLRVPIDAVDPRDAGTARPGDAVEFFIDGVPSGSGVVGERGVVQLLDLDPLNGGLPTISIADLGLYEGNSGTTIFQFTVTLSAAAGDDVTFQWGTAAGTATGGIDFVEVPPTTVATIAAGDLTTTLSVSVNGDTFQEDNETFFVNLSDPSPNAVIFDGQALGTILDDDRPPAISIADAQAFEGDAGTTEAVFHLTTTRPIAGTVTVNWATADGTATVADNDYQAASGVATFAPNTTSTTVSVQVVGDLDDESDETFLVNLSGASANSTIADGQAVGTIFDDDGFLTFVEAEDLTLVESLFGVSGLAVSPDGANLYATGQYDDAVAVFDRDPVSGALTHVETLHDGDVQVPLVIDGLDGAEAVTVSPDGAHVYVVGYNDAAVAVFARDAGTGTLTFQEEMKDSSLGGTADNLLGASALTLSPDGSHLYVASFTDDAVAIFSRDTNPASPTYGQLTYLGAVRDGDVQGPLTVNGLDGAKWLRLSPTGTHLYVAAAVDKAVSVFTRNAVTGALTFVQAKIDGQGGVNGLDGASSVAVSVDGRNVYVTGATENAIAVFGRNDATGALTFQTMHVDGVDGVDGLAGAESVAVSYDGRYVYVAGFLDDALLAFARDAVTGNLTPLELHRDGVGGEDGLARVTELAVSADDQHVYGAGLNDDAIAVFMRDSLAPSPPTTLQSPSHTPGVYSNDPTVDITWSGASDNPGGSGMAGYSIVFDATALTNPDTTIEIPQGTDPHFTTSPPLPDGTSFYFHLRACDLAGNCSLAQHLGPFFIDTTPPTNPVAILSTSHSVGVPSADRTIDMSWSAATDGASGVDGYSILFDALASTACDQVKDVEETTLSTTSASLADGTWYFHLCTRDNAGNWSSAAHAGPYIVEAAPPTVLSVETVADTDDGLLLPGEQTTTPITQLVVTFSEPVYDPVGNSDPDDVTNPANYQLLRPGTDGVFQTVSCVALLGDDVLVPTNSVLYFAATRTAVAKLNGGNALQEGAYRLLVCGSTSIVDLAPAPNPLDGNGDGTGGDDLVLEFSVLATDLLVNPNFDSGLGGWIPQPPATGAVRFDADDADGWAVSGSVIMEHEAGTQVYAVSQCVPVVQGLGYVFGGRARVASPVTTDPQTFAQAQYYGSTNCTVPPLGQVAGPVVVGDGGGVWADLGVGTTTAPAGAQSAYVSFLVLAGAAPDFDVSFDRVYFEHEVGVIFDDGFESGDTAQWSSTVP